MQGVLAVKLPDLPCVRENDRLMVELIVSYLAVVLHNALVCLRLKDYHSNNWVRNDGRRASYEENMLHVQKMVVEKIVCLP